VKFLGRVLGSEGLFTVGLIVMVVLLIIVWFGQINPDLFQAPNPGYQDPGNTTEVWP
jgi:hypothetical protein